MYWITRNISTTENICLKSKTALNSNINNNPKKSPSLQRAQKGGIIFLFDFKLPKELHSPSHLNVSRF